MVQGSRLLGLSPRGILIVCVGAVLALTFYTSHTIHQLSEQLINASVVNQRLERKLALALVDTGYRKSAEPLAIHDLCLQCPRYHDAISIWSVIPSD